MKSKRFFATLIDLTILSFIGGILNMILSFDIYVSALAFSLTFSLILCRDNINGQGIGKRLNKLKVVSKSSGDTASNINGLVRNIFLILWPVEILALLFAGTRIGDLVTGTTVVSSENNDLVVTKKDLLFLIYVFVVITAISIIIINLPSTFNSRLRLLYN